MEEGKKRTISRILFGCALAVTVIIAGLFFYNIIQWSKIPDFGFGFRAATGPGVVGVLTDPGIKAGLEMGDRMVTINGNTYKTLRDIRASLKRGIGQTNVYVFERDAKRFDVTIVNSPLGFMQAFSMSGFPYLAGLCYILVGTLVFLMKPHTRPSWAFYLFAANNGLLFVFLYKVSVLTPTWLGAFNIFFYGFMPATFLHLALSFPQERNVIKRYPFLQVVPYAVSVALSIIISFYAQSPLEAPKPLLTILIVYFAVSVLTFLVSCFQLWLKSASALARVRAKMILVGMAIAFSVPLMETVANGIFHVQIVPSFNYYLPFLLALPLFIGYSVVKHDLFEIDAIIKRTYGYILTTAAVAAVYGLVVAVSHLAFGGLDIAKSPVFPFVFILAVVVFFNPIRNRAQKTIDRIFYRLEYDYQDTVHRISGTMRYLQTLDQIKTRILDTILGVMFIESCGILLVNPEQEAYEGVNVSYDIPITKVALPNQDPLIRRVTEKKKEVSIYDVQEDPSYEKDREAFKEAFKRLRATVVLPLIYEDRLIGLMSLGNKKSGKHYRREDMNLLKTMANQGAVAIENARLADQMKEEEKMRANFARYLSPQIVDRIMKKDVRVNLGGDRKMVTVLFSDVRNFTRIAETLPPDQLVHLLNEYFTEMAGIIFDNQGSLDKYIGDAVVAVFGSLIELENHSQNAVEAAIQMMKRMTELNVKWQKRYGFAMNIGIGLNTGEVFLGNIGSPERMEFTVLGDTVNIASRFSGMAKPGQILVTRETLAMLPSSTPHAAHPPAEVKGKSEKLEVYEVVY